MTKQEFLRELTHALAHVDAGAKAEILADIDEHFTEGIAQGQSEADICRKLGQPGAIAAQIIEEYAPQGQASRSRDCTGKGITPVRGGYDINIDERFSDISGVNIKLTESKLHFMRATDGMFRVTIQGECQHDRLYAVNEGGTLVIKIDEAKRSIFDWLRRKYNLETTVYIPSQFDGTIKAKVTAGNITAADTCGILSRTFLYF